MRTVVLVVLGMLLTVLLQPESGRLVCSFETPTEVQGIKATGARGRGEIGLLARR
jgi:hypothetical protein